MVLCFGEGLGDFFLLGPLRAGLTGSEAHDFSEAGSPARLGVACSASADPDNPHDFPFGLSRLGRRPAPAPAWGRGGPRLLPEAARWRGRLGASYRAPGRASGRDGAARPTPPRAPRAPAPRSGCAPRRKYGGLRRA